MTDAIDTTSVRVLIVAAYASVRAGLHALLADADGIVPVGEVSGSGELLSLLGEAVPDVVLCDTISTRGFSASCRLGEAVPDVVLCDSTEGDGARVLQALTDLGTGLILLDDAATLAGALAASSLPGYALLRRDADGAELAGAVRAVVAGLIVFDRTRVPVQSRAPDAPLSGAEALTGREREVLQLMAQGLPNKQIAARLGISPHTAKFHVAAVLAKLGASSRAEAVTLGARRGELLL